MHCSLLGGNPEKRRFNRRVRGSAHGNGSNRAHAEKVLGCLAIGEWAKSNTEYEALAVLRSRGESSASTIIIEYGKHNAEASIPVYRQAVLIYNPVAGTLKAGGERLVERVLTALARAGHQVTVQ